MTRDPRVDPRPGDVVRCADTVIRDVFHITSTHVGYKISGDTPSWVTLKTWRMFADNGTVKQRGPDE